jgi:YVTN family beta-propeller protein
MNFLNSRQAARDGQDDRVREVAPGAVLVEIPVNNGPISSIAASHDGKRLMVTNYGRDSVSVIDTHTCRVLETVAGVNEPFAIAVGGEDANRAYVSIVSAAYDSIGVIDTSTNTVVATHPLALSVSDLVVSPDGKHVYASRNGAGGADVAVLDTATDRVEVIDLAHLSDLFNAPGTTAESVRVSFDGSRLYVGTNGAAGGQVVVIGTPEASGQDTDRDGPRWRRKNSKKSSGSPRGDTGWRVIETVQIGLPIRDVALSPDGAVAYVASYGAELGAVVDVIDTRTNKIANTRKIGAMGGILTGLTLSSDGDRAYLVRGDSVTVLSTLTFDVIGTLGVAMQPSCVVESPDGKCLYIADYSGTVTVAPIASTIPSGTPPAIESAAYQSDASSHWGIPELLLQQCEPALA